MAKKSKPRSKQVGKLPPQHNFYLNPDSEIRHSYCPTCRAKTEARKYPFLVFVFPDLPIQVNVTGPYCPACDLLILHQDILEELLTIACEENSREDMIGRDYVVAGILDPSLLRKLLFHDGPNWARSSIICTTSRKLSILSSQAG